MVLKTKRALKAQRSGSVASITASTQALFDARNRQLDKIASIKRAFSIYSGRRNSNEEGCNTVQEEPRKAYPHVRPTSCREDTLYKGNDFDDKDYTKQLRLLSINAYKPQRNSSFSVSPYSSGSPTTPPMTRPEFTKSTQLAAQPIAQVVEEHPRPLPRKAVDETPLIEEMAQTAAELPASSHIETAVDEENEGALLGDLVSAFPFLAVSSNSRPSSPDEGKINSASTTHPSEESQTTEDTTVTSGPAEALDKIIRRRSFGKKDTKHTEAVQRRADFRKEQAKQVDDGSQSIEVCNFTESINKPIPSARKSIDVQADLNKAPQPAERKSLPAARQNLPVLINSIAPETHSLQNAQGQTSINTSTQASPLPKRMASLPETFTPSSPLTVTMRNSSTASHHSDSRISTPSPRSEVSSVSPQPYLKISDEFHQVLREKGIDINGKAELSFMRNNRDQVSKKPRPVSQPIQSNPPKITARHIRQKSRDEVLLDSQVELLRRSLKDFNHVFAEKGKTPTDYLPGVFDEILTKDGPRRPRTSRSSTPSPELCSTNKSKFAPSSDRIGCSKKDELLSVLKQKLTILQQDKIDIESAVQDNTEQGLAVRNVIEARCNCKELEKYTSYVAQIERVTALLLRLSRRLAKAENALINAPSDATDDDKKLLEQKRNGLLTQHIEAKQLKEEIDESKPAVSTTLNEKLEPLEFQLYDNYINGKLKLAVELNDLEDQIASCKEQISAINESS